MPRYPNKVIELIKELPEGHSGLKKLIKKNYQKIDFDKLRGFDLIKDQSQIEEFYIQVIEEILSSNPEALELLKKLSVINIGVRTNIDRKYVERSYKLSNIEEVFNELLIMGILRKKVESKDIYEFSSPQLQEALESQADEKCHEYALKYYKIKTKKLKGNIQDDIEILFHRVKLNPTNELINEFLTIANEIDQFDNSHSRLIDIAVELLVFEEKYRAPILFVLGNILSMIGNPEDAERMYLNALDLYKKLAKQYYKIYLPYVAATQKNLGTLYIDLKRFEEAEKIYSEALSSYKELEQHYYNVHSPDIHLKEYSGLEESYLDDLKAYTEILKKYYDIYLPQGPSIEGDFGNLHIDLDLLEDIKDGTIDSMDSFKTLAKMSYDMYLIDIAKTQSNLGLIYSELMKFEDAERMHLEALEIKKKIAEHYPDKVLPELVLTLLDLGDLYATLNKFEDAEPMFNEALQISKQLAEQNPEVYMYNVALIQNSLGMIYSRLQKFEEAEQMYLNALQIFKIYAKKDFKTYKYNVADVQNNLGNFYLTQRNHEKADYYLNKAIKNDPTNINILYNIACLESLKNNQAKALELLSKAIELDKDYIERALLDDRFANIKDLEEFKKLTSE
ncbi:MAG: tetratricopeptide repeat protein [Candidatus Hodarchaeota archaeon]